MWGSLRLKERRHADFRRKKSPRHSGENRAPRRRGGIGQTKARTRPRQDDMPLPCMRTRLDARPRFVKSQYVPRETGGNLLDEAAPCALEHIRCTRNCSRLRDGGARKKRFVKKAEPRRCVGKRRGSIKDVLLSKNGKTQGGGTAPPGQTRVRETTGRMV